MEKSELKNMIGGWFVGDFEPSVIHTKDFEVAVKEYKKGDYEEYHHHKIADEWTVIARGRVQMNGNIFNSGDIIHIKKNRGTDFKALTDCLTVVVKIPSVSGDKYLGEPDD